MKLSVGLCVYPSSSANILGITISSYQGISRRQGFKIIPDIVLRMRSVLSDVTYSFTFWVRDRFSHKHDMYTILTDNLMLKLDF